MITISDLPVTEVVVLGFLDSDGNADPANPNPDAKDPVTLPSDNDFDVVEDEDTTARIYFGIFKSFLGDFYYDTFIFLIFIRL